MRAYFFTNMYLSSIQNGIQSAHCIADMFVKYQCSTTSASVPLMEWATNHKTMILLNGGYHSTITDLTTFFDSSKNPYPWAPFFEGKEAMNGMQTTVGIVLPEKIYDSAARVRRNKDGIAGITIGKGDDGSIDVSYPHDPRCVDVPFWHLTVWEQHLIEHLNSFNLAR